jgi:hypothetical protein
MRAEAEEKIRAERAKLESEAARIRQELEDAKRLRSEAETAQRAAADELARLREQQKLAVKDGGQDKDAIRSRIDLLDKQLSDAQAKAEAATQAQNRAETASQLQARRLTEHTEEAARLSAQIESEVEEWMREQEAIAASPEFKALADQQEQQMALVKQRAAAARQAVLEHDQRLREELSAFLDSDVA